jgi:tetratricopeptide (TPR) repeat protein
VIKMRIADELGYLGAFDKAKPLYDDVYKKFVAAKDADGKARIMDDYGYLAIMQDRFAEALDYFQKAKTFRAQSADPEADAVCQNLMNFGAVYNETHRYDQALSAYNQAFETALRLGDGDSQAAINYNFGKLYKYQGKYDKALAYIVLADNYWKAHGDRKAQAVAWNQMGSVAATLKKTNEAMENYRTSINLYQDLRSDLKDCPDDIRKAFHKESDVPYLALSKFLTSLGRNDDANHVLDLMRDDQSFPAVPPLKGGK